MKLVVVGASGTLGSEVVRALEGRHEVVAASRKSKVRVDISDKASIAAMLDAVGKVARGRCGA